MKMSKLLLGLFSVGFSNRIFFLPGYGYQQPLIYQQPGYQQPIIGTGNYYPWLDRNIDDNCDRTQVKSKIFSLFFLTVYKLKCHDPEFSNVIYQGKLSLGLMISTKMSLYSAVQILWLRVRQR